MVLSLQKRIVNIWDCLFRQLHVFHVTSALPSAAADAFGESRRKNLMRVRAVSRRPLQRFYMRRGHTRTHLAGCILDPGVGPSGCQHLI